MKAELDTVNGQPVLRLENGTQTGYSSNGKRATYDLPLTPEQARAINIHTEVSR
jgi:hypothetical protein